MATGFTLYHFADIHIRDTDRDKFAFALGAIDVQLASKDSANCIAVIAGDIFHYKTKLSGENLTDFYNFMDMLSRHVAHIIVIPGNHDANLRNDERVDLLTPVIANCKTFGDCRIHYWPKSGWNSIPGSLFGSAQFHVFSPLGEYKAATTCASATTCTKIAIIHDFIDGLRINGSGGHGNFPREFISNFDIVLCGHAHDYQTFACPGAGQANGVQTIVYPGSITQLTIGETYDKGYVRWDIGTGTNRHTFCRIDTPRAYIKYIIAPMANDIVAVRENASCKKAALPTSIERVVIEFDKGVNSTSQSALNAIAQIRKVLPATVAPDISVPPDQFSAEITKAVGTYRNSGPSPVPFFHIQRDLITERLKNDNPQIDAATIDKVIAMHEATMKKIALEDPTSSSSLGAQTKWRILSLEWNDLFCYGSGNIVDFTKLRSIVGVIAPNKCGKSAIIDILALALFNEMLRGAPKSIIRRGSTKASLRCAWEQTRATGEIARHVVVRKWDLAEHTELHYTINGANATGTTIGQTYDTIAKSVGTLDDFQASVLISQHSDKSFLDSSDARRRAIISRILGLDILDAAIASAKERIRENQVSMRALSSIIGMDAAQKPQETIKVVEIEAAKNSKEAEIKKIGSRIEELERINSVAKPKNTMDELNREIATHAARLATDEGEYKAASAVATQKLSEAETLLSALSGPDASRGKPEIVVPELRTRISQLNMQINQDILSLGLANKIQFVRIPNMIVDIKKSLDILRELLLLTTKLSAIPKSSTRKANVCANVPIEATAASLQDIGDKLAAAHDRFDRTLARECICASAVDAHGSGCAASAETIRAQENKIADMMLANFEVPESYARSDRETLIARMREIIGSIGNAQIVDHDAREAISRELAMIAVHFARTMKKDAAMDVPATSIAAEQSKLAKMRQCMQMHEVISKNEKYRADILQLTQLREATERQIIINKVASLKADLYANKAENVSKDAPMETGDITKMICAAERDIAMLLDLQAKEQLIKENLAKNAERAELIGRIEAYTTYQRAQLVAEHAVAQVESIGARMSRTRELHAQLVAQTEPLRKSHAEFDEYVAMMDELRSLRAKYSVFRVALDKMSAEYLLLSTRSAEAKRANDEIAKIQANNHILDLYQNTLSAKKGIQYTIASHALKHIEEQVNRTLFPIANLRIRLIFDNAGSGTMRIIICDPTRSIEHSADLCSGFQRFVINIALRRAFLRCTMRPMPQFLMIDEGFGCLDEANMSKIVSYLPELASDLDFMLIISHIDALQLAVSTPISISVGALSKVVFGIPVATDGLENDTFISTNIKRNKFTSRTKKVEAACAASTTSAASVASAAGAVIVNGATAAKGAKNIPNPAIVETRPDGTYFCKVCATDFKIWSRHSISKKHLAKSMPLMVCDSKK